MVDLGYLVLSHFLSEVHKQCCMKLCHSVTTNISFDSKRSKMTELRTNQGKVKGFTRNWEGTEISIYKNVPFAKVERFKKPIPYG